jgi:gluconate 2-dehydrogenase alpha chain
VIDEFNADNFDHTGLDFFGGGDISSATSNRRPNLLPNLAPGSSS